MSCAAATMSPMSQSSVSVVERAGVDVMFLRTADNVSAIQRGWARLETLVALRGRKFYGAFHPTSQEYWVCVERNEQDDTRGLGLETGALPGGRYLRARLRGEPPNVYDRIRPTFDGLVKAMAPDRERPSIEFYRSRDEIDCLLPV
jgi:hypothetical protein